MSLKINVSKVSTDDRSDPLPHAGAWPMNSLMDFFGDVGLITLYQLYRLPRDNHTNSHPPMLSPGRGKGFQLPRPIGSGAALRGSDHLSESRYLRREEATGVGIRKRREEKNRVSHEEDRKVVLLP